MRRYAVLALLGMLQSMAIAQEKAAPPEPVSEELRQAGIEKPSAMMNRYLLRQVEDAQKRWRENYEKRKTPEEIVAYQTHLRAKFVEAIGGFPERTPLNAKVTGSLQRDGFRVEKIIFESQPRHFVTGALFLPDLPVHKPPYPGVIVPCGHSNNGKAYDSYQRVCALAALNGVAAFIFDPIDQGERAQLLDAAGKPRLLSVPAHNMVGVGSILLGRNTARFEIWDGMRALDYLASRPDIDPKRLGCTGNSGGGTQTSYLMALDERIAAAAPACYICGLFGRLLKTNGAQDAEQNIFGQLSFGMDHADYPMMRAPKPTLMCTATRDFFNIEDAKASFEAAHKLYSLLGAGDRMSRVEVNEEHGFTLGLREAAVGWMVRWLGGQQREVAEPRDLKVFSETELHCTPKGQVMLLDGARNVYDLNRDYSATLAAARKDLWSKTPREEMLQRVRPLAGIRRADELPQIKVHKGETIKRKEYRIEKLAFVPEKGIALPALLFLPNGAAKGATLCVHADGCQAVAGEGGIAEKLVEAGRAVLAIDLRGCGQTLQHPQKYFTPALHGPDGQDFYIAYLLGRSYVGMRTEDILWTARWLNEQTNWDKACGLELIAYGHSCIPALHAAALEPQIFQSTKLVRGLTSWSNVVDLGYQSTPLTSLVHGALTTYDLPELRTVLGGKLTIEEPLDALGHAAEK
ncbi:MAG TPA: hypothetical protein VGP72_01475 [Planctomycetota bacterium]|jgi:dienelactone hydrolase